MPLLLRLWINVCVFFGFFCVWRLFVLWFHFRRVLNVFNVALDLIIGHPKDGNILKFWHVQLSTYTYRFCIYLFNHKFRLESYSADNKPKNTHKRMCCKGKRRKKKYWNGRNSFLYRTRQTKENILCKVECGESFVIQNIRWILNYFTFFSFSVVL